MLCLRRAHVIEPHIKMILVLAINMCHSQFLNASSVCLNNGFILELCVWKFTCVHVCVVLVVLANPNPWLLPLQLIQNKQLLKIILVVDLYWPYQVSCVCLGFTSEYFVLYHLVYTWLESPIARVSIKVSALKGCIYRQKKSVRK